MATASTLAMPASPPMARTASPRGSISQSWKAKGPPLRSLASRSHEATIRPVGSAAGDRNTPVLRGPAGTPAIAPKAPGTGTLNECR